MTTALYNAIVGHIVELFFVVASILLLYAIRFLKTKMTAEQQDLLQQIVSQTVLYVQQTMPREMGTVKLNNAVRQAVELAESKGISVDEEILVVMIESSIKELKVLFGEAWSETPP